MVEDEKVSHPGIFFYHSSAMIFESLQSHIIPCIRPNAEF